MVKPNRLLLCECAGSMKIDGASAKAATGAAEVKTCTNLCTDDMDIAAAALSKEGVTMIACAQQARLFADLSAEIDGPAQLLTVDIRDRAGWTKETSAHPKQAALMAEALLDPPQTPLRDVYSDGVCLIWGHSETVLPVAERLCDMLSVTCILTDQPSDIVPQDRFDVATGHIKKASGAFGGFEIVVDTYASLSPSGRGSATFANLVDGAKSRCDLILDLTGNDPMFPAPEKRDGYFRADPANKIAVERAAFDASGMIGTFEKPLHIRFDASICAHSRASQKGCSNCLDVCPTSAILPAGDTVEIDPNICAGCGACASVCPSGAASYDDPPVQFLFQRLQTLAKTYLESGGENPVALFHDETFGLELIQLSARFGAGLPPHIIPIAVGNVEMIGHAEILTALTTGFTGALVLKSPKTDLHVIESQLELARAVLSGTGQDPAAAAIVDARDPDELETALTEAKFTPIAVAPILPLGDRRSAVRMAANALSEGDANIALPKGAPYGAIEINADACTLCLACVSLCPVGALTDNPDKPQVNFQEAACLQCGICQSTCPETAISLNPRLNLSNDALSPKVLHEEEPFDCVSCGKPFGVKSTIERIIDQLKDKHAMFTNSDNYKLIQMCDDCRVNAQYHQENSPFKSADRPQVRTTQDYLDDRKKH